MNVTVIAGDIRTIYNETIFAARDVLIDAFGVDDVNAAQLFVVVGTILALYALALLHACLTRGRRSRKDANTRKPATVIMGCRDSGKTCMFQALKYKEQRFATVTSMAPGEAADVVVEGKNARGTSVTRTNCRLVDTPGHGKLRRDAMGELSRAAALVFVVDSSTFTTEKKDVAAYVFNLLSSELVQRRRIPIFIACNKTEKLTSHPPDFIRKRLEKEIDSLRAAKRAELPDIAITKAQKRANEIAAKKNAKLRALGQRPGEAFTFEAFSKSTKVPVSVGRTSATKLDVAAACDFIIQRGA